ncbi:sensor histidine kinase [Vibrio mediterranei]|uniref:sensor histidine kinase n=1 Tax=Vibrio mediterranei TaxID=689 RepID=UPI001EFD1688|nr:sensor histidine kinase [Vibrio mediterranei]MCG9657043.1 sensor histidine kinase [Vibrio mediterranei]
MLNKSFPLKNHLTSFFLGIAIITAFMLFELLVRYFEYGIEDSVKMRMLTEWRAYSEAYQLDPNIELPSSYVIRFYLDDLPVIRVEGTNILENVQLSNNQFTVVSVDETFSDDPEKEITLGIFRFLRDDEKTVYVIAKYDYHLINDTIDIWFDSRFNFILLIVGGYISIVLLALWFYSYRIGKRTEQLVHWSELVSENLESNPTPDFTFQEYNRVASYLQRALSKNARLLAREKDFLSHTSHELRTPLAIIRANMEILERIALPEASKNAIVRIDRASQNMQQVVETMLWLSRKHNTAPPQKEISVAALLNELVDEYYHFINGSDVSLETDYSNAPVLELPETPIRIVISNLLVNAFKYTHAGHIRIYCKDNTVIIENTTTADHELQVTDGFGLGQDLIFRICDKLGWFMETKKTETGFVAILHLPT